MPKKTVTFTPEEVAEILAGHVTDGYDMAVTRNDVTFNVGAKSGAEPSLQLLSVDVAEQS